MTVTPVIIQQIVRLFLGRGLRGEVVEEATTDPLVAARMEVSVDLPSLQVELEQVMLNFDTLPRHTWMPLTTIVGGVPELVWESGDGLIPTQVPIWHLGVEDETEPVIVDGVHSEEELP